MSFPSFMVQPVVVYNLVPGAVDPNGFSDEEDTFDHGTSARVWVAPLTANEHEADRETRESTFDVFAMPDLVIDATSQVEWRGKRHEIVGKPRLFYTRRGAHHLEMSMRLIEA